MATRREIQERRDNLRQALTDGVREGRYAPGKPLPPLRELAMQFGLSAPTAGLVVKELMDEGLVHSRSTAGNFVGCPPELKDSLFLFVLPAGDKYTLHHMAISHGFEERVAQLGANTMTLDPQTARRWAAEGRLPNLRGIFQSDQTGIERDLLPIGTALVEFGPVASGEANMDVVNFDNADGGRQAATHLVKAGHRRIAFLGLHCPPGDPGIFHWSVQREIGWREALESRGYASRDLSFLPPMPSGEGHEDQAEAAFHAARPLGTRTDITAVVTVNALATAGLFKALDTAGLPQSRWPAVVSFDDNTYENAHIVSAMRLPWTNIGREAAEMLWQRCLDTENSPSRMGLVPMILIPRMSCRPGWSPVFPPGRFVTLDGAGQNPPNLEINSLTNERDDQIA